MKFASKNVGNGSLSFLHTKISRENSKFVTSIYGKSIFSGIFTNFENFILDIYKRGLVETLPHMS